MQALTDIATFLFAFLGQVANAHPKWPTPLVKLGLVLAGVGLYALGHPPQQAGFDEWINEAWKWALAIPGAASLIGIAIPTNNSKPGGS